MRRLLKIIMLTAALTFFGACFSGSVKADTAACPAGHRYAGLLDERPAGGIAATINVRTQSTMSSGFTAAWVNIGALSMRYWLQAGVNSTSNDPTRNNYYYEYNLPGYPEPVYVNILSASDFGQAHRFSVSEVKGRRDFWQVVMDGRAVSPPIQLPGSWGHWIASTMAESYLPSETACNQYAYLISGVRVLAGGSGWQRTVMDTVQDPGYQISKQAADLWQASSVPLTETGSTQ